MDKKTVFVKTTKGENEVKGKGGSLSGDLKRALFLIDDKSTFDDILKRSAPSLRSVLPDVFRQLLSGGYIRDKAKPFAEPQIIAPRIVTPESSGELDFTAMPVNPAQINPLAGAEKANADAQTTAKKEADAARARAEFEAAVEATKIKSRAEAEAKAEANAKQAAEIEARNRAEAVARTKQEALLKAQAEAKAKIEAEARMQAEQAAALAKQQLEAAAKAKIEAEARLKAELEAAAKAKAEAEAARIKAEQEAARIKIELEAAKAKAEAEAKALAEERARQEAAEAARIKAAQEAARIKAEQEAAKAKAEAEARAFAEERARKEAEAARIKAEQEAARIKAEQEAAKAKADAAASALAEERARQETERLKAEQAAAKAEAEAVAMAEEQARLEAEKIKAQQEAEAARVKAEQIAAQTKAEAAIQKSEPAVATTDKRFEVESALLERTIAGQESAFRMAADAEAQKMADEQAKAWAEAEQRAKDQARAEAERPVQVASPAARAETKSVVSKARRKPLPTGKIVAALLVVLLLSVWLLPLVMPLADYVAPIEKNLSAQLKQPVHVGTLHAAILPWPKLQLEKVTVGSGQELKVSNVMLSFDPLTLFSPVKNIRVVELQDVTLDGAALEKESVWLQEIGANAAYQLSHVEVQRLQVASAEVTLPTFSGDVDINGQGRIAKIALKSGDGKFDLTLQPAQALWSVTLNAKGTTLPLFPNVLLDDFTANGEISASGANFAGIDVQAYGGFLHGNAKLTWQKGWQVQGHIGAKSVELVKLFPKFGVSGELQGETNFSSSGSKLGLIADVQQMDGSFVVAKGIVNNMDMVETVRLGNRQVGRTHFDELTGVFQSNGRGSHFQQLQITSGILSGKGSFDVGSNAQISGRLSVELKSRAGVSPLALSGTLTEPVLRPGR